MPPRFGAAAPAAQQAYSVQSGAPERTQTSRPVNGTALYSVAGTATRACPYRSTRRPSSGMPIAPVTRPAAETLPASAYEPRRSASSTTRETPVIDIESRPNSPAKVKAAVPGRAKSRR